MEPLRSTGSFNRRITSVDGNSIIAILDLHAINSKYDEFRSNGYLVEIQSLLEDLKVTVNLPSLLTPPFPQTDLFGGEASKQAELMKVRSEGQKISLGLYSASANGPWRYESEVVLQNYGGAEHHVPILAPFLSTNETLIVDGDWKLGVKIEAKWQQPLKASDFLVVRGTYRQIVSLVKKNDPELVALSDRLTALESLLGFFGAATSTAAGTNGLVKGAAINQEAYLLRGDRTWQDPSNLVTSVPGTAGNVTGVVAIVNGGTGSASQNFVGLSGNQTVGGAKTFTEPLIITSTTESTSPMTGAFVVNGGFGVQGFSALGHTPIKVMVLSFISPTTSANTSRLINQLPAMAKIISLTGWLKNVDTDWYPPSFYSEVKGYTNWWSMYSWSNTLFLNLHPASLAKMGGQTGRITVIYTA